MIPNRTRPFDIIASLLKKSVSSKTTYTGKKYAKYKENKRSYQGILKFYYQIF